jgi:5-methylcytosine-specific restriction endonuclease McrA
MTKDRIPVKVGSTILLLNSTYEPLHMMNWKRATVLVLKNKAHVVSKRTIRLKNYVKIPTVKTLAGKPTRTLILKRDDHTCQYCEYTGPKLTLDHIVPKSRGGGDTWQNLVTSCLECNNCKDNRTPEEWAKELLRIFDKETVNTSALPYTWDSFQIGMLETRVRRTGTTLIQKPRIPYNKMSITIGSSDVKEWREYVYV